MVEYKTIHTTFLNSAATSGNLNTSIYPHNLFDIGCLFTSIFSYMSSKYLRYKMRHNKA